MSSSSAALSMAIRPLKTIYPKLWFQTIPEPARFMTSACIGNIIFFYIDVIIYEILIYPLSISDYDVNINAKTNKVLKILLNVLPPKKVLQRNRESISFFISYLIQIFAQHLLNAIFVYGLGTISTKEKYIATLVLTYSSYFISLVGSTFCNVFLLRQGLSKNIAFWGTVFGFGCLNFLLLKALIGGKKEKNVGVTTKHKLKESTDKTTKRINHRNINRRVESRRERRNSENLRTIMRGGAVVNISKQQQDFNYFSLKILSGVNHLVSSQMSPQMAFVKSIKADIEQM